MGEWISVKDKLPTENDYVRTAEAPEGAVIWYDGFLCGLGWYDDWVNQWTDIDDNYVSNVTHWMKIPETPEKERTRA